MFSSFPYRREGDIDFLNTLVKEINDEVRHCVKKNSLYTHGFFHLV